MAKTFLPQLFKLLRIVCIYTARYDKKIRENLPPNALPVYDAYNLACAALMVFSPDED